MNELEKATLATMVVQELLKREEKILAVKIVRFMYDETLRNALDFVNRLETV